MFTLGDRIRGSGSNKVAVFYYRERQGEVLLEG